MKTISTLILATTLSACALLNPPKFDSLQYGAMVDVRQIAAQSTKCDSAEGQLELAQALTGKVDWDLKYTEFLTNDTNAVTMLTLLKKEVDEFAVRAEKRSSPTYCKAKLELIQEQSTTIQRALAKKG